MPISSRIVGMYIYALHDTDILAHTQRNRIRTPWPLRRRTHAILTAMAQQAATIDEL